MFVTIINDCRDGNAFGRQATRAMALFNSPVTTVGIEQDELEASGNLVDMLDASEGEEGVILVNVAPRHGRGKKWPNGTPFGYFTVGKTLVVASVDGVTLSLVKKLGLLKEFNLFDIPTVMESLVESGDITEEQRHHVINTQFRSYDFLPHAAAWLREGKDLPSEVYPLENIPEAPQAVWFIDNFGNCKTSLFPEDITFEPSKTIQTALGELTCYNRLKDVPNGEAGLIIGSSGYGEKRFLEVVRQGQSAAKHFTLTVGSPLFAD